MEKRKTNLTVEDFEDKKYGEGKKAGRYTRFLTDQGWISSFDKKTIEKLKDSVDKCVSVEIATDDNDKEKITKFFGAATEDNEVSEDVGIPPIVKLSKEEFMKEARKSVKGSNYEKDPVGLAVECFCAIQTSSQGSDDLKQDIKVCIDLVKQVQEAFK